MLRSYRDLQNKLLSWYRNNKRDLPFRHTKDPYKIWLSEIMLQQTTVATVIDYYNRFIKKFPNVQAVAMARDDDLLTLWQGLGYYARVRNFKKACEQILTQFNGKVPEDFDALKSLRGIGDYTAAAIASIAFNKPHAVVDGNVKRVLARLFYYQEDIAQKSADVFFKTQANKILDVKNPGDFNQAIMELGATVCRPQNPSCPTCPVSSFCAARDKNPDQLPIKKKATFIEVDYFALLHKQKDSVLLEKPSSESLIAGMWSVPLFKTKNAVKNLQKIGVVKHSITNKKITTHVYNDPVGAYCNTPLRVLVNRDKIKNIPINTLTRKILRNFFV